MTLNKEFLVTYHFGAGIKAERIVNAENIKEVNTDFGIPATKSFTGPDDTFYQFNLKDVKLVSVKENKKTTLVDKPAYL